MEPYHYVLIYLVFHFLCGALSVGIHFAESQGRWPTVAKENRRGDLGFAWMMGLFLGPIALVITYFISGFAEHGLKWK